MKKHVSQKNMGLLFDTSSDNMSSSKEHL